MTTLQVPATAVAPPGTPLRRRIGAGQALAHSLTLAWRNVTQLKHSPEKLLDVTLMPIVFVVLFLYVFGAAVAGSTHAYLELLLPGLVAQMAMFGTMGLGTALCEDIHKGVFDRFRSLPIARSAPLVGAAQPRLAQPHGLPGLVPHLQRAQDADPHRPPPAAIVPVPRACVGWLRGDGADRRPRSPADAW